MSIELGVAPAAQPFTLSTKDVDSLLHSLAKCRAKMTPVHPAEPPRNPSQVYESDNLLWCVAAATDVPAVQIATQHPGLGWSVMQLSRAQAHDMLAAIEFALQEIAPTPYRRSENID